VAQPLSLRAESGNSKSKGLPSDAGTPGERYTVDIGPQSRDISAKLFERLAMKISLSPDLERLIAEKVSRGRYRSADEVVREGLELLQERENETRRPPSNGNPNLAAAFESIASDVPYEDWESIPAGLSKNLDQHLYGGRKSS
jgi:Arc/MetJ-type ribon-helix-helix transcriptional regulator